GEYDRERQPERLEIRGQQQEDDQHSQEQAGPQASDGQFQRRDLTAHTNCQTAGRLSGGSYSLLEAWSGFAERESVNICRETDDVLSIEALDEAGHRAILKRRDVGEERVVAA